MCAHVAKACVVISHVKHLVTFRFAIMILDMANNRCPCIVNASVT